MESRKGESFVRQDTGRQTPKRGPAYGKLEGEEKGVLSQEPQDPTHEHHLEKEKDFVIMDIVLSCTFILGSKCEVRERKWLHHFEVVFAWMLNNYKSIFKYSSTFSLCLFMYSTEKTLV